jgi:hypothetical protein
MKQNSGSTFKQWQKGISMAQGEWIWIAESDDVADFTFLVVLIAKTKKYSALSIVYSQSLKIDSGGKTIGSWRSQTQKYKVYEEDFFMNGIDFINDYLIFQNFIPNASAVIFKINIELKYKRINLIDSNYTINGDWYFWTELLKNGNIYYSNETLNKTRFHNQKGSNKNIENFNNIKESYFYYISNNYFLSKKVEKLIYYRVFEIWEKQSFNKGYFILGNLRGIFLYAIKSDRLFVFRLLKLILKRFFLKIYGIKNKYFA